MGYIIFWGLAAAVAFPILFASLRFTMAGVLTLLLGSLTARKPLIEETLPWEWFCGSLSASDSDSVFFFYVGVANTSGC